MKILLLKIFYKYNYKKFLLMLKKEDLWIYFPNRGKEEKKRQPESMKTTVLTFYHIVLF